MAYTYRCSDYPGMQACPASFTTETEDELWQHLELHGAVAHQEDPTQWTTEERQQVKDLIHSTDTPSS